MVFDVIILNIECQARTDKRVLQIASDRNYGDAHFNNQKEAQKFIDMAELTVKEVPDSGNFEFKEFNHLKLLKSLIAHGFTAEHSACVTWANWEIDQSIWKRQAPKL